MLRPSSSSKRSPFPRLYVILLILGLLIFARRGPSFDPYDENSISTSPTVKVKQRYDQKPFVAIVACTKSWPQWKHANESTVYSTFLPSIVRTISADEWTKYRIEVVLGFDTGDDFWEKQEIRAWDGWGSSTKGGGSNSKASIVLSWLSFQQTQNSRIPFNQLCRATYDYGADYIVRVNDDTIFSSKGWLSEAVAVLSSFDPPNIGVVGPTSKGDKSTIMTHDMVSRIHLEIFDTYYPKVFKNYYVDDWISNVYGAKRTQKIDTWKVVHLTSPGSKRYSPSREQKKNLQKIIAQGSDQIQTYIESQKRVIANNDTLVLGGACVNLAEGPIAKVHKELIREGTQCLFN
jgi:hypothetical protein